MRGAAAAEAMTLCGKTYSHVWTTKRDMPMALSDMTATTVGDTIYLIGGCSQDQLGVNLGGYFLYSCGGGLAAAVSKKTTAYSPLTDTYSDLPDMPRARYRHAAAEVGGKIYLFGGTNSNDQVETAIDVFDTSSGQWSTLAEGFPNATAATTDNGAFAYGGKIYVVGGYDVDNDWAAQQSMWIFDPSKSGSTAWSEGPELFHERGDFAAIVVGDSAYVLGGFYDANNFVEPLATLERFDVGVGATSWRVARSMTVARGDKAVATVNGALHVIGGETKDANEHSVPLNDVEVYHPDCNEWQAGGDIPSDRFRFTAAAHGDSIFIFGGQGYLQGAWGVGSKYPVLSNVEVYTEKVDDGPIDTGAAAQTAAGALGAALLAASLSLSL